MREKIIQCFLQRHVPVLVVRLKLLEEIREHVRVPLVQDPVGLLKHQVEVSLRVGQEIGKEF